MATPISAKERNQLFTKVKAARELLRQQAEDIVNLYMENAKVAMARGDHETAQKALQWLLEHMPAEVDGSRVVDMGIDKQVIQQQGPTGPMIQIGINVGGIPVKPLDAPKVAGELPPIEAEVIDERR